MTLAGPGLCGGGSETKRSYGRMCREWVWIKVVEGGLREQLCEALKEKTSVMWFPVAFILLRRIRVLGSAESTWVIRGFPHSIRAVGTRQSLLPHLDWDVGCLGIRGTWILSRGTGESAWSSWASSVRDYSRFWWRQRMQVLRSVCVQGRACWEQNQPRVLPGEKPPQGLSAGAATHDSLCSPSLDVGGQQKKMGWVQLWLFLSMGIHCEVGSYISLWDMTCETGVFMTILCFPLHLLIGTNHRASALPLGAIQPAFLVHLEV